MDIRNAPVTPSSAAQEALETAAQTRKEAANGDQQAVRKLAAAKVASKAAPTPPENPGPPGTGKYVKVTA